MFLFIKLPARCTFILLAHSLRRYCINTVDVRHFLFFLPVLGRPAFPCSVSSATSMRLSVHVTSTRLFQGPLDPRHITRKYTLARTCTRMHTCAHACTRSYTHTCTSFCYSLAYKCSCFSFILSYRIRNANHIKMLFYGRQYCWPLQSGHASTF